MTNKELRDAIEETAAQILRQQDKSTPGCMVANQKPFRDHLATLLEIEVSRAKTTTESTT